MSFFYFLFVIVYGFSLHGYVDLGFEFLFVVGFWFDFEFRLLGFLRGNCSPCRFEAGQEASKEECKIEFEICLGNAYFAVLKGVFCCLFFLLNAICYHCFLRKDLRNKICWLF